MQMTGLTEKHNFFFLCPMGNVMILQFLGPSSTTKPCILTLEKELHFCTRGYTKRKSMDDEVNVLLQGRIALLHSGIYGVQYLLWVVFHYFKRKISPFLFRLEKIKALT